VNVGDGFADAPVRNVACEVRNAACEVFSGEETVGGRHWAAQHLGSQRVGKRWPDFFFLFFFLKFIITRIPAWLVPYSTRNTNERTKKKCRKNLSTRAVRVYTAGGRGTNRASGRSPATQASFVYSDACACA
jgi:hypothetical protein